MSYEELSNVEVVVLGGVDKETRKSNPTELEGYLVRVEKRPNRFNPAVPQNFYIFLTSDGEKGVYGKAGINSVLKNATLGAMTKLVATDETLDTGKGNPMKVFKAYQDRKNTTDVQQDDTSVDEEIRVAYENDDLNGVEEELSYEAPKAPPVPRAPQIARAPSAASIQNTKSLLKGKPVR